MSHNAKSKAKGVSATSFFDLKAELVKQETEFSKARAAGDTTVEVKRTEKVGVALFPSYLGNEIANCINEKRNRKRLYGPVRTRGSRTGQSATPSWKPSAGRHLILLGQF